MKNNCNTKHIFMSLGIVLLVLISLGFYSISSTKSNFCTNCNQDSGRKVKTYSFTTKENQKRIYWTAVIRNGKIESLYKNDDKLSDAEIEKYKDIVFQHAKDLDNKINYACEFTLPDSNFYFDNKAFQEQMKILNERMKNFKFNFHFDSLDVNRIMEQVNKNLEKLKSRDFFNKEQWAKMSEKLSKNFNNHNFDFRFDSDFDKLNMSLDKLDQKMKDLNIKMDHLKDKMRNLKEFLKDVKSELIKDGYLDKNEDKIDLDFTKHKMEVNGKQLPDSLLEKYKKIYKDHFGKEIGDSFRIVN